MNKLITPSNLDQSESVKADESELSKDNQETALASANDKYEQGRGRVDESSASDKNSDKDSPFRKEEPFSAKNEAHKIKKHITETNKPTNTPLSSSVPTHSVNIEVEEKAQTSSSYEQCEEERPLLSESGRSP